MFRYAVLGLVGLVSGAAWAQQAPPPKGAPAPSPSAGAGQPSKAAISWEEPLPSDHWTFAIRDEITGSVSATRTSVVTEVTPTDIQVRFKIVDARNTDNEGLSNYGTDNTDNEGFSNYDRSWNLISSAPWQHWPYDGTTGIQTPLTVGKTWTFQSSSVDKTNGTVWKRSGTSEVVGQETVTTKAGTFEAFKIETTTSSSDFKDPTRTEEMAIQTWYAPAIAHWVKRIWVVRTDKHLRVNNTYELVDYGRKE